MIKQLGKTLITVSWVLLLSSGCGGRASLNRYNVSVPPPSSWDSGLAAGLLPQNYDSNTASANQPVVQQITPITSQPTGQLNLSDTASDFGDLNYCYTSFLNQGNSLLQQGSGADYVFQGAGQELVRCYYEVIKQRTKQLNAYQTYQAQLYQQQYMERMYQLYYYMSALNQSQNQFQPVKPPSSIAKSTVKKK